GGGHQQRRNLLGWGRHERGSASVAAGGEAAAPGLAGAYRRGCGPRFQPGWTHPGHWELGWVHEAVGGGAWRLAVGELGGSRQPARRGCPPWSNARKRA